MGGIGYRAHGFHGFTTIYAFFYRNSDQRRGWLEDQERSHAVIGFFNRIYGMWRHLVETTYRSHQSPNQFRQKALGHHNAISSISNNHCSKSSFLEKVFFNYEGPLLSRLMRTLNCEHGRKRSYECKKRFSQRVTEIYFRHKQLYLELIWILIIFSTFMIKDCDGENTIGSSDMWLTLTISFM